MNKEGSTKIEIVPPPYFVLDKHIYRLIYFKEQRTVCRMSKIK